MEGGGQTVGILDRAIAGVYERAEGIKAELREKMPKGMRREMEMGRSERGKGERKRRGREVVRVVLDAPRRVRVLVGEGRMEEARVLWEEKSRLLEGWRERGVGGEDVQRCIDEGEAALRGNEFVDR